MAPIVVDDMGLNQSQHGILRLENVIGSEARVRPWQRLRLATVARLAAIALVLFLAGGSTVTAQEARTRRYTMAVAGFGFDLLDWELRALGEKASALAQRPASGLEPRQASALVVEYMARARQIGEIEADITRLLSEGSGQDDAEVTILQTELDELRTLQTEHRVQVEQIIEWQVGYGLGQAGFTLFGYPFPPVQFTFTEPPKKLIVSPRERIATEHSRMLDASISLSDVERAEAEIDDDRVRSYITNIGGLGAFPTMVIDRASLSWVLSTVAHEWTHNYLALHPLGWNYFKSQDMTTMNESVAEIVGNEIGANVDAWFYSIGDDAEGGLGEGEAVPRIPYWEAAMEAEFRFDFREEMRRTRLHVDELLNAGRVEEAERYMEERRQVFVEHGYPLRVLNQAYFAFHGSYGTSAASTSPIGPKLDELRANTPDLATFLATVQHFTDVEDLDQALGKWVADTSPPAPSP